MPGFLPPIRVRKPRLCIAAACLALVLTLLFSAQQAAPFTQAPAPGPDGLTVFFSQNGELDVTLVAQRGTVQVGALAMPGATFNGDYPGPVLHVRPGDMLRARLVNHLDQPTNLHFHGMRTSPLGNSDNVHLIVAPGATLTYEMRVPIDQPPGVYWYHAHPHGISEAQVMGGLTGTLIVDPPATEPAMPQVADRLFVLKDHTFDDDTGNATIDDVMHGIVISINGRLNTELSMRPGETQRWRFTNQSANRALDLALDGHRFQIVARDGADTVGEPATDVLSIMPASRVDVLVVGAAPGTYALRAKGIMTGTGDARVHDRVLGQLTVAGAPATPVPPKTATLPPDLRGAQINVRRTVLFTETIADDPALQQFFINGRRFDADRVDVRAPLGSTEEWTIRNDSDDLHVFHIHQVGFQVIEIGGQPAPFTGWVDTVPVPARTVVKLRMQFTDPLILGRFMFHCHILGHEDRGMMAQIEIYRPKPPKLIERVRMLYRHIWWWLHGVPWAACGIASA